MKTSTPLKGIPPIAPSNSPLQHDAEQRLWTSSEAVVLCGLNVLVFGFTVGHGHYDFVFALLLPSLVLGLAIGVAEAAFACWRHGPMGLPIVQTLATLVDDLREALSLTDVKPLRPLAQFFKKLGARARHPSLRS